MKKISDDSIDFLEKTLKKLEQENRDLKLKIKDAHVENASLQEDFNQITPSFLYKIWKIVKPLYSLISVK